ncbi:putative inositol-1-monophosphatase/fructose-1, 6-bisphosphatase [Methanocella paludicola SANAE]|uniref:fructose-bisphosphatase n=1 Tax=Methanocella paludicola (strain DSM 17711 / JCM 13418 / NBRC 101707 / SANAE) TaxID=304371 RepID=D1YY98_METPS|nr:inositol monophosphatase family protein [Methanocella paludicola]BAI61420.1 putative inositol-1-monophosphatase/fructose-1, 6-bisphosphatase [Methanocella paludicola SANAE]
MTELSLVKRMAENVLKCSTEYLSSHLDYDEVLKRRATDVTRRIDMVAEEALDAAIIEEGISARIISEELGEHIVPAGKEPEYTLIMDPIDGSANLSMGIPYYCTSLALSKKTQNATFADIDAGAVAAVWGKTFYASKGQGAFYDGERLATKEHPEKPRYVLYSFGVGPIPKNIISLVEKKCLTRTMGSVALDMSQVARGSLDAIIDSRDRISGYDIMAASLILKEAGGVLTGYAGNDMSTMPVNAGSFSILGAANSELHKKLLESLH